DDIGIQRPAELALVAGQYRVDRSRPHFAVVVEDAPVAVGGAPELDQSDSFGGISVALRAIGARCADGDEVAVGDGDGFAEAHLRMLAARQVHAPGDLARLPLVDGADDGR